MRSRRSGGASITRRGWRPCNPAARNDLERQARDVRLLVRTSGTVLRADWSWQSVDATVLAFHRERELTEFPFGPEDRRDADASIPIQTVIKVEIVRGLAVANGLLLIRKPAVDARAIDCRGAFRPCIGRRLQPDLDLRPDRQEDRTISTDIANDGSRYRLHCPQHGTEANGVPHGHVVSTGRHLS